MRMRSISIENFRSIQNAVTIRLCPITLLFGPNSAGKSSILQSVLTFREVLQNRNPNPHFVYGGGNQIDLGGFKALVHAHELDRTIKIRLDFDITDDDGISDGSGLAEAIESSSFVRLQSVAELKTAFVEIGLSYDETYRAPYISRYAVGINDVLFGSITKDFIDDRPALVPNFEHPIFDGINDKWSANGPIKDMYEHMSDRLRALKNNTGEGIEILTEDRLAGVMPVWGRLLPLWGKDEDLGLSSNEFDEFRQIMSEAFVVIGGMALNHIKSAIYLGPIRSIPLRTYSAPERIDINRWSDGLAAWDTLCLKSQDKSPAGSFFVKRVSDYLSSKNDLDLGYSVEVLNTREINNVDSIIGDLTRLSNDEELSAAPVVEKIKRDLESLPRFMKVLLRDEKRQINVEADDIGVGVSQVVPVVVGALDSDHKVFFVEQPELHMHPRVQCALGDLFIEQINASSEKLFVLETHSEHLILRLLRRVRQTTETKETQSDNATLDRVVELLPTRRMLDPEQVAVIYIESDENGMHVTDIPISSDGEFQTPWPKGFFEERMSEVF